MLQIQLNILSTSHVASLLIQLNFTHSHQIYKSKNQLNFAQAVYFTICELKAQMALCDLVARCLFVRQQQQQQQEGNSRVSGIFINLETSSFFVAFYLTWPGQGLFFYEIKFAAKVNVLDKSVWPDFWGLFQNFILLNLRIACWLKHT